MDRCVLFVSVPRRGVSQSNRWRLTDGRGQQTTNAAGFLFHEAWQDTRLGDRDGFSRFVDDRDTGWNPHIGHADRFRGGAGFDSGRRGNALQSFSQAEVRVVGRGDMSSLNPFHHKAIVRQAP